VLRTLLAPEVFCIVEIDEQCRRFSGVVAWFGVQLLSTYPLLQHFYVPLSEKILDEAERHLLWLHRLVHLTRLSVRRSTSRRVVSILEIKDIAFANVTMKD